ncbi:WD40 repeat domain-containing serine/threonine protein kinase [Actinomadura fulvescens]|uniref:Protein kinase domain-containing protein n=1 Tax=Actinomadura fulvescens TaxID=46160 RepID=A0ABP6CII0_9ACTN
MTAPLQPSDPRQLGGYWLAARLGAGGQGVVYEGYDAEGNRVAVKALYADAVSADFRNGLRKEVAMLQRVASFCTARIIAADLDNPPPYIVSEYVPGPDLQSWVDRNGAYGPDELYRLAIGIATALSSIHQAGVIHRDLKPANVLLGPDGPRVIDFGIAKSEEMTRSATGQLKGTPRWMAPEIFKGRPATPAVDVWAWAAIVLFAATGRPPFDGDSLPTLMHQVLNDTPETDVLTGPLRTLVESALDRDPAKRPTPHQILTGLIGGGARDPLEAGTRAASESSRPSMALPPSLAELAERVYGGLDPHAQEAVPRILLRMVAARPDAQGALVNVNVGEFADGDTDERTVHRVLDGFGKAGLLHGGGPVVAISTPALLRAWPRMRDWVDSEREGLGTHHALAAAARVWDGNGRKQADLYQGSFLDEAVAWASTGRRQLTLNLTERAFLDASVNQTRSRARRRTVVTAALAVLLVIATGSGGAAVVQSQDLRKTNTIVAQQRDTAVGKQLAAQAVQLRRTDPVLARRLAVAAGALAGDTLDAQHALLTLSSQWEQDIYRPDAVKDTTWEVNSPATGGPYIWWKQNTLIVADPGARQVRRTLTVPGSPIAGIEQSLDGKRLLTLQKDGTMLIWDTTTGASTRPAYRYVNGSEVWFSPTGSRFFVRHKGQTHVVDATGKIVFTSKQPYHVWDPAMSPDERYLLAGRTKSKSRDKLDWWDLQTSKRLPVPVPNFSYVEELRALVFSPDGRFVAAEHMGEVLIIDAKTRELRTTLAVPKDFALETDMVFSPDGEHFAYQMALWSTEPGSSKPFLHYQADDNCRSTRFSADGTSLRCVDSQDRVRSIDVGAFVRPSRVARENSSDAAISGDGSTLAVAERDAGNVQLWDTGARARRETLPIPYKRGYQGDQLSLSRDGRLLAHGRSDGAVDIWDVRSRTKRTTVNPGPVPLGGRPLPSFSPDGKALATHTPKNTFLQFWDASTGRLLGEARPKQKVFSADGSAAKIAWSADGKSVISTNDLGVVEFPSGKQLVPPNPLVSTVQALSPQGTLATVQDRVDRRSISFWDAKTLQQKGNPVPTPDSKSPIAAISPDGRLLATTDKKGNIDLWDVRNQRRIGLALTGHTRVGVSIDIEIHALAFSADGTRVHSVSGEDGRLVTHIVAPRLLKDTLCRETGPLSAREWAAHVPDLAYRKTC